MRHHLSLENIFEIVPEKQNKTNQAEPIFPVFRRTFQEAHSQKIYSAKPYFRMPAHTNDNPLIVQEEFEGRPLLGTKSITDAIDKWRDCWITCWSPQSV